MPTVTIVPDIASMGDSVGARVERHLESAFRAMLRAPGSARTASAVRLITGAAHPFGNFAALRRSDDVEATRESLAALAEVGAPTAMLFAGGAISAPVRAALEAAGYGDHGDMAAMAVDIDAMAPAPAAPGCSLERIGAGAASAAWGEVFSDGYELPREVGGLFAPDVVGAEMAPDAPLQWFGVVRGGRMVSTSMLFLHDGIAGIYGVSTLPEARRQGLGAFATAGALLRAREVGYRVGALQSSQMGRSVYERLGFRAFGGVPLWVRMPGH